MTMYINCKKISFQLISCPVGFVQVGESHRNIIAMKYFLALLAIVAFVSAEDDWKAKTPDEMQTIRDACAKDLPLSEEQIGHMKNLEYPNEDVVRKYLMCAYEKMGIYCPHMGFHADRIAEQFKLDMEVDAVKKIVDDCLTSHPKGDKSNEVYVYDVHKCLTDSVVGEKYRAYIKKTQQ